MMVPETAPAEDVRHHMTSGAVMAGRTATIVELARMMTDSCVSRVIVTDSDHRPIGAVSATDLVAALADGSEP